MMSTAQELRAAVDPQAVMALIAAFPEPDRVGCRKQFDPAWIIGKPKQDLNARLVALEARRAPTVEQLASDMQRYADLRSRGLDALSDFDCTISSNNDPFAGLHMAFSLKVAHISYSNSALAALDQAIAETLAAMEADRPQMGLF
jgi:hypothetical protein